MARSSTHGTSITLTHRHTDQRSGPRPRLRRPHPPPPPPLAKPRRYRRRYRYRYRRRHWRRHWRPRPTPRCLGRGAPAARAGALLRKARHTRGVGERAAGRGPGCGRPKGERRGRGRVRRGSGKRRLFAHQRPGPCRTEPESESESESEPERECGSPCGARRFRARGIGDMAGAGRACRAGADAAVASVEVRSGAQECDRTRCTARCRRSLRRAAVLGR
jgi:hypothetical protein